MERNGTLAFAETQPAAAAVAASRHIVYSVWNAAVPPSMKRAALVVGGEEVVVEGRLRVVVGIERRDLRATIDDVEGRVADRHGMIAAVVARPFRGARGEKGHDGVDRRLRQRPAEGRAILDRDDVRVRIVRPRARADLRGAR